MSLIFELLDFLSVRLNIITPSDFMTMTEKITGPIERAIDRLGFSVYVPETMMQKFLRMIFKKL